MIDLNLRTQCILEEEEEEKNLGPPPPPWTVFQEVRGIVSSFSRIFQEEPLSSFKLQITN